MSVWQRNTDVAIVESEDRISVVNLAALEQPPVVMTGAAWLVYDAVNGSRDTARLVEALQEDYPDEPGLEQQVRDCLAALESVGLITSTNAVSP